MTPSTWRPVITAQHEPWDEWHSGDPSVVERRSKYYMAYSSTGNNLDRKPYGDRADRDGSICCVMGAASTDGITWKRSRAPILLNKADLGAPTVPQGDTHLYGSYHRPSLMWDRGRWRVWFDYWTPKGLAMGCAQNRGDFLNPADWKMVRADDHPSLQEWPNPDVIRVGGLYYAYADPGGYDPKPWVTRKIAEAVSANGLDWLVLGYVQPDRDAPAIHVPEALVRKAAAGWEIDLFYACQIGGDPYDYRYDRIRMMRRLVTPAELQRERKLWDAAFPRRQGNHRWHDVVAAALLVAPAVRG